MSVTSSTGTEAKLYLTFNSSFNHINFIKLRYYDSLLMNTPYKLYGTSNTLWLV